MKKTHLDIAFKQVRSQFQKAFDKTIPELRSKFGDMILAYMNSKVEDISNWVNKARNAKETHTPDRASSVSESQTVSGLTADEKHRKNVMRIYDEKKVTYHAMSQKKDACKFLEEGKRQDCLREIVKIHDAMEFFSKYWEDGKKGKCISEIGLVHIARIDLPPSAHTRLGPLEQCQNMCITMYRHNRCNVVTVFANDPVSKA